MNCPACKNDRSKVTDKRQAERHDMTRRRRQCLSCGHRFTTYEVTAVLRDGGAHSRPEDCLPVAEVTDEVRKAVAVLNDWLGRRGA